MLLSRNISSKPWADRKSKENQNPAKPRKKTNNMIQMVLQSIFGTQNTRTLKKMWPVVHQVNALENTIEKLSEAELRAKTDEFRKRLAGGQSFDDILPEAFAVVREAS